MDARELIKDISRGLPKFADGRTNFTKAKVSPVLSCAVFNRGQLLIVKRSDEVLTYPGDWNGISGFIDTDEPVEDIAKRELYEEAGITEEQIASLDVLESYEFDDTEIGRTWVVFPVRVLLSSKPEILLNEENTEFSWVDLNKLEDYEVLQDFKNVIKRTMP